MTVRTRFAPSPTGHVHIGNIRAAIYNWLFAHHHGGDFLLRVEDTDRERSTPEACQTLLEVMTWLDLKPSEEPLYQSSRQQAHLVAAEDLLARGLAYKEDKGGTGKGEAVLFRMPGNDMAFHDLVKGDLQKDAAHMADFVIVRSNGTPVFHLANVVDDIEMGITHVIRGDDHIENTYRHIALYQALQAPTPHFAHLPMIVNAQGKPYSKRDGDAYVGDFRDKGYLPDALFNYLTLLGWSPGDDREVMSRDDMVSAFTLDRVQASAAQVDVKKLEWMNGEYMRILPQEEREQAFRASLEAANLWTDAMDPLYFQAVCTLMADRVRLAPDFARQTGYFFTDDYPYEPKPVKKGLQKEGALDRLGRILTCYQKLEPFDAATLDETLHRLAEEESTSIGGFMQPLRVAVSGSLSGPDLFATLALLGRKRVLCRLQKTITDYSG